MLHSDARNSCRYGWTTSIGHVVSSPFDQRPRREDACGWFPSRPVSCISSVTTSKEIAVRSLLPTMAMILAQYSCRSQRATQVSLSLWVPLMKSLNASEDVLVCLHLPLIPYVTNAVPL